MATFLSGSVYAQATTLVIGIAVARHLGPSDYGVLSVIRNVFAVTLMVAPVGMDLGLLRYLAGSGLSADAKQAWLARVRKVIAVGTIVLTIIMITLLGPALDRYVYNIQNFTLYISIAFIALPFSADLALVNASFRAFARPMLHQIVSLYIFPSLRFGFIAVAIMAGAGAAWILGATTAATICTSALACFLYYRMQRAQHDHYHESEAVPLSLPHAFSESVWLMGCLVLYGSMRSIDILTVGAFCSPSETGAYAALSGIAMLIPIASQSVSQTLGPEVAKLYARQDSRGIQQLLERYLRSASLLSSPVFAGVALFAPWLTFLFGSEYEFRLDVAIIVSLGYFVSALYAPMGYALSMTGRHRLEMVILLLSFLVAAASAVALTPEWGAVGAATAVLCGFIIGNVLRIILIRYTMGIAPSIRKSLLPPVVSLAVAFAASRIGDHMHITVVSAALAVGMYIIATGVLFYKLILTTGEQQLLMSAVRRLP